MFNFLSKENYMELNIILKYCVFLYFSFMNFNLFNLFVFKKNGQNFALKKLPILLMRKQLSDNGVNF